MRRPRRNGSKYGNVYDHFAFDLDYPDGLKGLGMNAQIENIASSVTNTISGSKGEASVSRGHGCMRTPRGSYNYEGSMDGDAPMHQAMCEGIRTGEPINQGRILAEATMTGIIGRMSVYAGQSVMWKWAMEESKLDLSPKQELSFEKPFPVPLVCLPGQTKLV